MRVEHDKVMANFALRDLGSWQRRPGNGRAAAARLPFWAETGNVCSLTPELTVGPYYMDYELMRRDIREGRPGVPLDLRIAILHARTRSACGVILRMSNSQALPAFSAETPVSNA